MGDESRRIVIIGRTSSGKSSVMESLSERGYNTLDEVPRTILNFRKSMGISKKEIEEKQILIYQTQLHFESICEGTVFFERGLPCSIAYSNFFLGYVPWEFDESLMRNRYHKVFTLDGLKFESDGVRIESGEEEAQKIQDLVEETYRNFGYDLINVPKFLEDKEKSIGKRVKMILENLG